MHHPKIRIAITSARFVMKAYFIQPGTNPILKMKLLVLSTFSMNKFALMNGVNTSGKKM
jgi:hypothetical protein